MLLFALNASATFGAKVAAHLEQPLASHVENDFEDGEHKTRVLQNVAGHDVYVIHALYSEPAHSCNDKLCRLLFFISCLRDAGARCITAVLPYCAYARQDRKVEAGDPVTLQYLARLLEAAGADRVVSLDIHNLAAYQNAFRIPAVNLEAQGVFAAHLAPVLGTGPLTVVSPDTGGILRARQFRDGLASLTGVEAGCILLHKERIGGKVVRTVVAGEPGPGSAIIIDDIISTGATIGRAVEALAGLGTTPLVVVASHGIFTTGAVRYLSHPALTRIVVSDSIPPSPLVAEALADKLEVVSVAPLVAATISNLHEAKA